MRNVSSIYRPKMGLTLSYAHSFLEKWIKTNRSAPFNHVPQMPSAPTQTLGLPPGPRSCHPHPQWPPTHTHTNAHVMDALHSSAAAAFAGGDNASDDEDDENVEEEDDAADLALLTDAGAIVAEDQLHHDRMDDDDDGGEQGDDAEPDPDPAGGTTRKRTGNAKNLAPAKFRQDITQGGKTPWLCPFDLETTGANRYTSATCQFGAVSCISVGTGGSVAHMPSADQAAAGMEFRATYNPRDVKWDDACTAVHGMSKASSAIFPDDEREAARKLYAWMNKHLDEAATKLGIDPGDVFGVFIVHNGDSCDLDWLYHIGRKFAVWPPDRMKYYWDTYTAVRTPPPPPPPHTHTHALVPSLRGIKLYFPLQLHSHHAGPPTMLCSFFVATALCR